MTFSLREVADRYRVTEHTVRAWIECGDLRALNVGVRDGKKKPRIRITQEALDEFENSRTMSKQRPAKKRRKRQTPAGVEDRY